MNDDHNNNDFPTNILTFPEAPMPNQTKNVTRNAPHHEVDGGNDTQGHVVVLEPSRDAPPWSLDDDPPPDAETHIPSAQAVLPGPNREAPPWGFDDEDHAPDDEHGDLNGTIGEITREQSLLRSIQPVPMVFADLETIRCRGRDLIVEICLVRIAPYEPPRVFHTLVDPGLASWEIDLKEWSRAPHGITPEMVTNAPYWPTVLPMVRAMCHEATIVAHNASFERRVLEEHFGRYGKDWDFPYLCTLQLARSLFPDRKRPTGHRPLSAWGYGYRLEDLARDLEVFNEAPHRAPGDVMCLMTVLSKMLIASLNRPDLADIVKACIRPAGDRWIEF